MKNSNSLTPYNFNTLIRQNATSNQNVQNINFRVLSLHIGNTKFSELIYKEMNRNQKAELMIRTWKLTSFPTCPPALWIISFMDDGLGSTLCVTYTMISCRNWRRILICLSTHTWDISGFTNFQSCQNWNWIGFFSYALWLVSRTRAILQRKQNRRRLGHSRLGVLLVGYVNLR